MNIKVNNDPERNEDDVLSIEQNSINQDEHVKFESKNKDWKILISEIQIICSKTEKYLFNFVNLSNIIEIYEDYFPKLHEKIIIHVLNNTNDVFNEKSFQNNISVWEAFNKHLQNQRKVLYY